MKETSVSLRTRYITTAIILISFLVIGQIITSGGMLGRTQNALVIQVGFYIILAVSLNLVAGYMGQLPLGHAGFMAVGAYTAAIFWRSGNLPGVFSTIVGIILAGLMAAAFGVIIGIPALRLKGDYLSIVTLGFGEIIRVVINNLDNITYGARGLLNIPRYSTFMVVYICVIITIAFIHMLMRSRHGRAILSIRDNEIAAKSCGINVTYYKVATFAISAFFAGIAGALMAGNQGILLPANFDFMTSVNVLMIVVLGGLGSMVGSVISATVLISMPVFLQPLNEYRMIIYSILLIGVMIFKPTGLMGIKEFSLSYIIELITGRKKINSKKIGKLDDERKFS